VERLNRQDINKYIPNERSSAEACQCTPARFASVNILTNVKKSETPCPNQQRKVNLADKYAEPLRDAILINDSHDGRDIHSDISVGHNHGTLEENFRVKTDSLAPHIKEKQ
jgi:hypothetical protein